jgi:UDP-N-acetylmuramyl pentapeptide phosphotransferase/UDP-N-acetylglucosamine-1-phosphate transferase
MKNLKRHLIIVHTVVLLLSGWGGWLLMQTAFPVYYFTWYPYIPAFFLTIGIVFISILDNVKKMNPRKSVNLYMLLRFSKVLASLIFAGIYFFAVKVQLREFGVVFISFYLLYLALETYYFYLTENEIKKIK